MTNSDVTYPVIGTGNLRELSGGDPREMRVFFEGGPFGLAEILLLVDHVSTYGSEAGPDYDYEGVVVSDKILLDKRSAVLSTDRKLGRFGLGLGDTITLLGLAPHIDN